MLTRFSTMPFGRDIFFLVLSVRAACKALRSLLLVHVYTSGGGPSDGSPPITPPLFTTTPTPRARSARRMARNASNPAVHAPAAQVTAALSAEQISTAHYAAQISTALSAAQISTARSAVQVSAALSAASTARAAGVFEANQVFLPSTPAPFAVARRSIMESPTRSTAGARDCGSTPRTRLSRPASNTCSPEGTLRFPSTPEGEVDFEAPDTEDEELDAREMRKQQEARSPRSLSQEELLEQAALWQAHKRSHMAQARSSAAPSLLANPALHGLMGRPPGRDEVDSHGQYYYNKNNNTEAP